MEPPGSEPPPQRNGGECWPSDSDMTVVLLVHKWALVVLCGRPCHKVTSRMLLSGHEGCFMNVMDVITTQLCS
eukprot:scaffold45936_cov23-Tisochrysis_lutea.AAC.2